MAHIPEDIKKEILEKANLHNTISDYLGFQRKSGAQWTWDCVKCNGQKNLQYQEKKGIIRCFKCETGTKSPVQFLMDFFQLDYPSTLRELARIENIEIPSSIKKEKLSREEAKHTYLQKMLNESGLTSKDITGAVYVDDATNKEMCFYESGTIDQAFNIVKGDDVIIHYYDLEGHPMTYYKLDKSNRPTGNPKPFYRVRYQNPELHPDKDGKPVKYRSPKGSDTKAYIPAVVRKKYNSASKIETLFIQEGEKKADKATKHGMISVGVSGIHNIAYKNILPVEFELIINRCQVDNVVFVLDADWQDLSTKLDQKKSVDLRPRSFARAVINFKKYFYAFTAKEIYLNIYMAHVKPNPNKDKGIDDLLTNSLKGKENELIDNCKAAISDPVGDAGWLQFYNITTMGEYKIMDMWHITSVDKFVNHSPYKDILKDLPKFKYGKIEWRIATDGSLELAQPLMDDETFWYSEQTTSGKVNYKFNHKRAYNFLQNRGYGRLDMGNNSFTWVYVEDNVVYKVEPYQIKDYVVDFTKQINQESVENMLYRGAKQYLGPDSLSHIDYLELNLHKPLKNIQFLYFNEAYIRVSDKSIELKEIKELGGHVWKDSIIDFTPSLVPNMITKIHQINEDDVKANSDLENFIGEYTIDFHSDALSCDFLHFLLNTSSFCGRNTDISAMSLADRFETTRHLLSKITAFGYMLHGFRNPTCERAVIGMDGQMSEVGKSNGRSGKSLFGVALEQLVPTVTIQGKKKDLLDDKFLFEEVDQRTAIIFFDDVRVNFDFEFLFPFITGKFTLEKKGHGKMTLPRQFVQKFYISTNHALSGEGGSFEDRQFLLGFSDWYDSDHKPIDDFKVMFFNEWDEKQWNLFYNFAALSLHMYLAHGLISAPREKLIHRRLRQEIGESFLDWADEYFSNSNNVNVRIYKNHMYDMNVGDSDHFKHGDGFVTKYPSQRRWCNIAAFKKKLKRYCEYKGYDFNPTKKGDDIKTGGKEFIEIFIPIEDYENLKLAEGNSLVDDQILHDNKTLFNK